MAGGKTLKVGALGTLEACERGVIANQRACRRIHQQVLVKGVHEETAVAAPFGLRMQRAQTLLVMRCEFQKPEPQLHLGGVDANARCDVRDVPDRFIHGRIRRVDRVYAVKGRLSWPQSLPAGHGGDDE